MAKNIGDDVQYHSLLEKCKSKLVWGTNSHQLEWPSSKSLQTINAGEGVEKREPSYYCSWECKLVQTLWKTVWRYLRKLNIELPYDPAIPPLGMYLDKTTIQKDTCILMFIAELFKKAKTWKQPLCPLTDEWTKKMWYIYTMEYYSVIKKRMK